MTRVVEKYVMKNDGRYDTTISELTVLKELSKALNEGPDALQPGEHIVYVNSSLCSNCSSAYCLIEKTE